MNTITYPHGKTILICGPTASGKSALGIEIARKSGGCIINADALQVYDTWRILTARPSVIDEKDVPHHLYGHVPLSQTYSVGAWLRDVKKVLEAVDCPVIILGGTGLYFSALTSGLAEIPETPSHIRTKGNEIRNTSQGAEFIEYLSIHDPETLVKTDQDNPMRLQRAWEVHQATGRGLASWQKDTPPPLVSLKSASAVVLNSSPDWLNARIARRFDHMVADGALDECRTVMQGGWEPSLPSSRALGARELVAYLHDECTLDEAKESATIATRQFAKRQRSWFRNKMQDWQQVSLDDQTDIAALADRILQRADLS
jgi:tRNA dimethylallyltransferase